MKPEDIVSSFKKKFDNSILEEKIEKKVAGIKKKEFNVVWLKIDRKIFKDAVKHLIEIQFPHFAVISGDDIGNELELNYHFSIQYAERLKEISVNLSIKIPKDDPTIETITDIIPGALVTERETQEMFGIVVKNIPDKRRIFLSEELPIGAYPWRKDKDGVSGKIIHKLDDKK